MPKPRKSNQLKKTVMGSEVIIMPIMLAVLFGIVYLYYSTRHKERLALIDKGVDATIFMEGRDIPHQFGRF